MNVFPIKLPEAQDQLGQWMHEHAVEIRFCCTMGAYGMLIYTVVLNWSKTHSFSDEEGHHKEEWILDRSGSDLAETIGRAVEAAMKKTGALP